jgi:hypothetical protein
MTIGWQGVFPAVTTQFHGDFSLGLESTRLMATAMAHRPTFADAA